MALSNETNLGFHLAAGVDKYLTDTDYIHYKGYDTNSATLTDFLDTIDNKIITGFAANNALVFKGTYTATTSGAINTNKFSPAPSSVTTTSSMGWMWIVTGVSGSILYFGSEIVENGDLIISKSAQPGITLANYYLILKNIDPSTYVTLAGVQTITGTKTFNLINVTGSATFSQAINGDILGNATTSDRLKNARTINGVLFDGSANITITANPNSHTHNYAGSQSAGGSADYLRWENASSSSASRKIPIAYASDTETTETRFRATYYNSLTYRTDTNTISSNISGNAATVTNGVYTIGDLIIGGIKTFNLGSLYIKNDADGIHLNIIELKSTSYNTSNRGSIIDLYAIIANSTAANTGTKERKLTLSADSEGGNIRIYSPTNNNDANYYYYSNSTGSKATNFWEVDNYNGNLRFYSWDLNGTTTKASSNIFPLTLKRDGKVYATNGFVGDIIGTSSNSNQTYLLVDNSATTYSNRGILTYSGPIKVGTSTDRKWQSPWGAYESSTTEDSTKLDYGHVLRFNWSGTYYTDFFVDANDTSLAWRRVVNSNNRGWKTIIDSSNYSSYSVSLTTAQTISGNKTFTGNITFSGSSTTMDSLTAGNLVVQGTSSVSTVTSGTWLGTAIADSYIASAATWNAKVSANNAKHYIKIGSSSSNQALSNDFTANASSDVTTYIPLATQATKASGAADNSGTNTWGTVKGCAEGSTGEGAWRLCKVTSGLVYYYDRTNSSANISTPNEAIRVSGTSNDAPISTISCILNVWSTNTISLSGYSGTYAIQIADSTNADGSGTTNYYTGQIILNGSTGRREEIALLVCMATSSDTAIPTRIFASTYQGALYFASQDTSAKNHYFKVKILKLIAL